MKNLNAKLLLAAFLAVFVGSVGAMKVDDVLAQLKRLAGKTEVKEEGKTEASRIRFTKSRRRVSVSGDNESLEVLVKQIVLFNDLIFDTIENFENKFMETFSNKEIAENALEYMKLVVDSHNEALRKTKQSLDLDKLPNGFFKLAWRIKWAEDNNVTDLAARRKKIFNTFIVFLTGLSGGFNADKWESIQLTEDEKKEAAGIILKLQAFNPDLKWPDGERMAGFPVFIK